MRSQYPCDEEVVFMTNFKKFLLVILVGAAALIAEFGFLADRDCWWFDNDFYVYRND